MLASFRKLAGTWPARIFFIVLGVSFMSWGVADVVTKMATGGTDVATVEGHGITPAEFQLAFQNGMRRVTEQFPDPAQIPPGVRDEVARQTLEQLVTQAATQGELKRLGVAVPDEAVRDAVFAMPAFHGPDGKFRQPILLQVLQNNGLTETRFLDLMRQDLARGQLIQTLAAGVAVPGPLAELVYGFVNEKRSADMVILAFAGQTPPAAPADPVLRRFYDNNAQRYTAPEYRHVKMVVLSPDTVGRGLTLSDSDLHAWFDQHKSEFVSAEKRSLQVITTSSRSVADALAAQWKGGASWEGVQAAAKAAGASAVPLDNATPDQVPSPELAKAAFASAAGSVTGPIVEPLGFQVVRVSAITPAKNPGFDELREVIRGKAAADKALDLIDARAQKLQDLFAGGAKIDEVPADLGAAGAEGTLDPRGMTAQGEPAPIPGTPALRAQIIEAAFRTGKTDAITPVEGPDHAWFALAVDSITPPAKKPFDQVRAQVLADWQQDQIHHTRETDAARLLGLVKNGQSLANAAWGSGLQVTHTAPLPRDKPAAGVPAELVQKLFGLKPGEPAMVETNTGFVVAALASVVPADAKTDKAGLDQVRDSLATALKQDTVETYAAALRRAAKPTVNLKLVQNLTQPAAE